MWTANAPLTEKNRRRVRRTTRRKEGASAATTPANVVPRRDLDVLPQVPRAREPVGAHPGTAEAQEAEMVRMYAGAAYDAEKPLSHQQDSSHLHGSKSTNFNSIAT